MVDTVRERERKKRLGDNQPNVLDSIKDNVRSATDSVGSFLQNRRQKSSEAFGRFIQEGENQRTQGDRGGVASGANLTGIKRPEDFRPGGTERDFDTSIEGNTATISGGGQTFGTISGPEENIQRIGRGGGGLTILGDANVPGSGLITNASGENIGGVTRFGRVFGQEAVRQFDASRANQSQQSLGEETNQQRITRETQEGLSRRERASRQKRFDRELNRIDDDLASGRISFRRAKERRSNFESREANFRAGLGQEENERSSRARESASLGTQQNASNIAQQRLLLDARKAAQSAGSQEQERATSRGRLGVSQRGQNLKEREQITDIFSNINTNLSPEEQTNVALAESRRSGLGDQFVLETDPRAQRILNNPNISREDKITQLEGFGFNLTGIDIQ